jgi:hypothetical protein
MKPTDYGQQFGSSTVQSHWSNGHQTPVGRRFGLVAADTITCRVSRLAVGTGCACQIEGALERPV